eukprot:IDg12507t1
MSGQNNPEAAIFQKFVTPSPNSTTMLALERVGYDDDDEDSMRGGRGRAKRNAQVALLPVSERRSKSIEAIVATISSLLNYLSSRESASDRSKTKAVCNGQEEEMGLLQHLQSLTKRREEIMALNASDLIIEQMISALDRELNKLHNEPDSLSKLAADLLGCGPPCFERGICIFVVTCFSFVRDFRREQAPGDVTAVHAKIMETHDASPAIQNTLNIWQAPSWDARDEALKCYRFLSAVYASARHVQILLIVVYNSMPSNPQIPPWSGEGAPWKSLNPSAISQSFAALCMETLGMGVVRRIHELRNDFPRDRRLRKAPTSTGTELLVQQGQLRYS